jgi:hypothetical protein
MTAAQPISGHVFRYEGKRRPTWRAKYRLPDGRQVQKTIGPAWTARGRPPAGYWTKRTAEAWLRRLLVEAAAGTLPGMVRTGATVADACAEYLRYVDQDRQRKPSTLLEHSVMLAMAIDDPDDHTRLYIGPARNAARLEVATNPTVEGPELAIHAMPMLRIPVPAAGELMASKKKTSGTTRSGRPIDDDLVEKLAAKAKHGYDVDQILRRRGGRPPIGSGPAMVESVRLDPELSRALAERAERDHESTSSVIRKALRSYLRSA